MSSKPPTSAYQPERPHVRSVRVYASDPSLAENFATAEIHEATIEIPWESDPDDLEKDGPAPGPVGEYIEVLDFDPASDTWYEPCDLNSPYLLAQDGHAPSDGNPQFHQQMVYAVAMKTVQSFERALGRRVLWAPRRYKRGQNEEEFVHRLRIYPHALREANAYYSPNKMALLFGYFRAPLHPDGRHMPGSVVFTCLSQDIIAHETTHAILDGIHRRYLEPSNPDVLAFHEAFSDIVALFQQFSNPALLTHEIRTLHGKLSKQHGHDGTDGRVLGNLARQFGLAIGRGEALRRFAGQTPDPLALTHTLEPHDRGAVLVAAVFQAFIEIYRHRSADLWRIARVPDAADDYQLHPDLVGRLAREAAKSAEHVMNMCIRAVDYLPPVDLNFGDFLRALVTADIDAVPNDDRNYRIAVIEAFRRWGIYPNDVRSMSVEALRWEGPSNMEAGARTRFGSELKQTMGDWSLRGNRRRIYEHLEDVRRSAQQLIQRTRRYKAQFLDGIDLTIPLEVHSVRPLRRVDQDGQSVTDVVMELTQSKIVSRENVDLKFRGGCTLIFDLESGEVRYCISKHIHSDRRLDEQFEYLASRSATAMAMSGYSQSSSDDDFSSVLSLVHRSLSENSEDERSGE